MMVGFSLSVHATITGTAFLDYNGDGAQTGTEPGLAGIEVTLVAQSGVAGFARSDESGSYSIDNTVAGPYRIEFSRGGLTFLHPSFGTENGSSVRNLPATIDQTVDVAFIDPGNFVVEANPDVVTTCFATGLIGGANDPDPSLISVPYDASGHDFTLTNPPVKTGDFEGTSLSTYGVTGATYGLAWQSTTSRLYVGAFHKRYTGFGSAGPDGVYQFDAAGTLTGTLNLDDLLPAGEQLGADVHPDPAADPDDIGVNNASFDGVGKRSLGDLEMSDDMESLFVMNLRRRSVHQLDVTTGNLSEARFVRTFVMPDATEADRHRPFGLKFYRDRVWVGSVDENGAEAYVHSFDPAAVTTSYQLEFTVDLTYQRQALADSDVDEAGEAADWNAWEGNAATLPFLTVTNVAEVAYPQPMLTDLEFDGDDLILGFRDRFGDQSAYQRRFDPGRPALVTGTSAGDILRACRTAAGFALEGSANCPTDGGLTNSGPGGATAAEFYQWDLWALEGTTWNPGADGAGFHWEITQGALLQLPGQTTVVSTAMNPNNDFSAGIVRFENETGVREGVTGDSTPSPNPATGGYTIYDLGQFDGGLPPDDNSTFGKGNGLGDLAAFVAAPGNEIGDYVWNDTNGNGVQDPGEPALTGVSLQLFDTEGVLLDSTFTSSSGNIALSGSYRFAGLEPNTKYFVVTDTTNTGLNGLTPTAQGNGGSRVDSDTMIFSGLTGGLASLNGRIGAMVTTGSIGENDFDLDLGFTVSDFGDAPDTYLTSSAVGGAQHGVVNGVKLGASIDSESDGSATIAADGDGSDEDGVSFGDGTTISETATSFSVDVTSMVPSVTTSETFSLIATDDFNVPAYDQGSGWSTDWVENTDDGSPATGAITIEMNQGESALCTDTGPIGSTESIQRQFDFSSAVTDASITFSYSVDDLEDGESVTVLVASSPAGPFTEITGTPALPITGANNLPATSFTQFSGTIPLAILSATTTVRIEAAENIVGSSNLDEVCFNFITITAQGVTQTTVQPEGTLVGWIDFDRSGTFEANEAQVLSGAVLDGNTTNTLTWDPSASGIISSGPTYARFRLSTDDALTSNSPAGIVSDGEVEDYLLNLTVTGSIGDRVFLDTDGNGLQDTGELGVGGVVVRLLDADNGNVEVATTTTDGQGFYSFIGLDSGNFFVVVEPPVTFIFTTANEGGNEDLDSDFDPESGQSDLISLVSGAAITNVDAGLVIGFQGLCYAVSNEAVPSGSNDDHLFRFDEATNQWGPVGPTGVGEIEAITLDLQGTLFAVNRDIVGTLDTETGAFTALPGSAALGMMDGEFGSLAVTDVDGLSFDPYREELWAVARRNNRVTANDQTDNLADLLFRINPVDGTIVRDAFGQDVDYVQISPVFDPNVPVNPDLSTSGGFGREVFDCDDIAFNTANGNLYAIQNANGSGGVLTELSAVDGSTIRVIGDFGGIDDIEGLSFDFSGNLFGTSGNNGPDPSDSNTFYDISVMDGSVRRLQLINQDPDNPNAILPFVDFEGVDCFSRFLTLGNLVWNDANNDGIFQADTESTISGVEVELYRAGDVPGEDLPLDTEVTVNGEYLFVGLPNGDFFVYVTPENFLPGGPLAGLNSSTGNGLTPPDPDDNQNDDDNGQPDSRGGVFSQEITLASGTEPGTDSNLTVDFGFTTDQGLSSLGDFVFFDGNQNGRQDSFEEGVGGVPVRLLDGDDPTIVLAEAVTLTNGFYSFEGLPAGSYLVEFDLPAGFSFSPQGDGSKAATDSDASPADGRSNLITLAVGTNDPTIDAGIFFESASVGDRVWVDEDGDGDQDAGEPGIPNVTVNLLASDGVTVLATTITDIEGRYLFGDLAPGDYQVQLDLSTMPATLLPNPTFEITDSGAPDLTPDGITEVSLTSGEERENVDFGFNYNSTAETNIPGPGALAAVGDRVWLDANGNGEQDSGERGIAEVTVRLFVDPDGDGVYDTPAVDDGGNELVTVTDSVGNYLFDELEAGGYVVMVDPTTLPAGLIQSGDPDDVLDDMATTPVVLAPGDVVLIEDFGYTPVDPDTLYLIDGVVFFDADADGSNTPTVGEFTYPRVTVVLLDLDGNVLASTVTDATGRYEFPGLEPGSYTVRVVDANNVLDGLRPSADQDGSFDGENFLVIVDTDRLDNNFGYTPQNHEEGDGLIGDTVFIDRNENLAPDSGEGVEGVTVTLRLESTQEVVAVTTTSEDGRYFFGGLDPNEAYRIIVDNVGILDGLVNTVDPTPNGNSLSIVDLADDSDGINDGINLEQDFGYNGDFSLGGTVWTDTNADGILIPTDEPDRFEGVTIVLRDPSGNIVGTTVTDSAGDYSFENLPAGTFTVDVTDDANVLEGYWKSNAPDPGIDSQSQVDPYEVTIGAANPDDRTADFGYYIEPGAVGNFVYLDENNNGIFDGSDTPSPGRSLKLTITYANGDTSELVTTTGADGFYQFGNLLLDEDDNGLPEGASHSIMAIDLPGVSSFDGVVDAPGIGNGTEDNSDNEMGALAFPPQGGVDDTNDFGFAQRFGLGNLVFIDDDATNNADGIFTPGQDTRVPAGVAVSLFTEADPVTAIRTTVTDSEGRYFFGDLDPGRYIVGLDASNFQDDRFGLLGHNATVNGATDNGEDDDMGHNARVSADPTVVGIRSTVIELGPGLVEPLSTGTESGDDNLSDPADASVDLTIDLGLREFEVGTQGCFYVSGTGQIVPGGGIIVTGEQADPTNPGQTIPVPADQIVIVQDGTTGCFGWDVLNVSEAVYCVEYRIPAGYVIDPSFSFESGIFDAPQSSDLAVLDGTVSLGQADADPADGFLDANAAVTGGGAAGQLEANPAFEKIRLEDGDAAVLAINIPLVKASDFDTWAASQSASFPSSGAEAGPLGNPDGDGFSNLLEYALCMNPTSGLKTFPDGTVGNFGFQVVEVPGAGGTGESETLINGCYYRPGGADIPSDLSYELELYNPFGDPDAIPAVPFWSVVNIPAASLVTSDGPSGSAKVTIEDLESVLGVSGDTTNAILRLSITLNGSITEKSKVQGFNRRLIDPICETISDPFGKACLFTGTLTLPNSSDGFTIDFSGSLDGNSLLTVIDETRLLTERGNPRYYIEVVDPTAPRVGELLDIMAVTDSTVTIADDTDLYNGPINSTHLGQMTSDFDGSIVVIREHKVLTDVFPPQPYNVGTNALNGSQILLLDRSSAPAVLNRLSLIFSPSGPEWRSGTVNLNDRVLPPSEGSFSHNRGTAGLTPFEVVFTGEVRTNRLNVPLREGDNLISSVYPVDQSPRTREVLTSNGFVGGNSPVRADLIRNWTADFVDAAPDGSFPEAFAFEVSYLLQTRSRNQWTLVGDTAREDRSDMALFERDRSAIIELFSSTPGDDSRPDYFIPAQIELEVLPQ